MNLRHLTLGELEKAEHVLKEALLGTYQLYFVRLVCDFCIATDRRDMGLALLDKHFEEFEDKYAEDEMEDFIRYRLSLENKTISLEEILINELADLFE